MQICQETIIILHGWQSSKEKWQTVKQELLKHSEDRPRCVEIKVIVPDLPGFKKETELDRVWDLDNYINWFEKFISCHSEEQAIASDEESLANARSNLKQVERFFAIAQNDSCAERFFLLGHSFGGRMAIKFAAKYPEKLKGLILVSSAGIIPEKTNSQIFTSKLAKIGKLFSFLPFYSYLRKIFYRYILIKTDYLEAEKTPYLKETFKNVIKEDLTPYLSQIKTQTLIIWGEKDKMTPLSDAYLMKEKIKNSRIEIMKDIGHAPHLENPEILSQKIKEFVEDGLR